MSGETAMTGSGASGDERDLFGGAVVARLRGHRQLPLPLGWQGGRTGEPGFIVGAANRDAVRHIEGFADWPAPASLLIGPRGSGRSALGAMFMAAGGMAVIDPLERADETALFHAWNRAAETGGRLLVIADDAGAVADIVLPDLRTRLSSAPVVAISEPDEALTSALIDHLLVQRRLAAAPGLSRYIAARIERSYAAIHASVAVIDAAALAAHAPPTVPLARAALIGAGLIGRDNDEFAEDAA
jgi:Bacterial dnaA  protein